MKPSEMFTIDDVRDYVEKEIRTFHEKRLQKLQKLKIKEVLSRKNPYLFKAKNVLTAESLIRSLLDAYLSSQEETLFGDFLEGLAVFVCNKTFGGKKSIAEGINLEFDREDKRYIVSIKSGPNWGNSSQIKKLRDNFRKAKIVYRQNYSTDNLIAINGCCYGRGDRDTGDFRKVCGQAFWELISGNNNLYLEIIEPVGHKAKERNERFLDSYSKIINKFTFEFMKEFCDDGEINWNKLVAYNSAKK